VLYWQPQQHRRHHPSRYGCSAAVALQRQQQRQPEPGHAAGPRGRSAADAGSDGAAGGAAEPGDAVVVVVAVVGAARTARLGDIGADEKRRAESEFAASRMVKQVNVQSKRTRRN
jgi:hypothetical protein